MDRKEKVNGLIIGAGEDINFAPYGEGTTDEWVHKVEERMGLKLPESYVWWLKNYYGGEIYGEIIYSIYEEEFDELGKLGAAGDVVLNYEQNIKDGVCGKNEVVVSVTDEDTFYFDARDYGRGYKDLPVYSKHGEEKEYAENFIHFLERRIQE